MTFDNIDDFAHTNLSNEAEVNIATQATINLVKNSLDLQNKEIEIEKKLPTYVGTLGTTSRRLSNTASRYDRFNVIQKIQTEFALGENTVILPLNTGYTLNIEALGDDGKTLDSRMHIDMYVFETSPTKHTLFDSPEEAINAFLTSTDYEFHNIFYKFREILQLTITEIKYIQFTEHKTNSIAITETVINTGREYTQELFKTEAFVSFFREFDLVAQRVKKQEDERIANEIREKNYSLYKQWEWLESKRKTGSFEEFTKTVDTTNE